MPSTAQNLIEVAYLRSTANAPGKLAVDQEMVDQLNRIHLGYCALLAATAPERWIVTDSGSWTGTPATLSIGHTDIVDIHRVENTTTGQEITIGPVAEKARAWFQGVPFCWRNGAQNGAQLFSRGTAIDPQNTDGATYWYLDAPASITALSSTIDGRFPARFEMLLILDLAIYLSLKDVEGERSAETDRLTSERQAHYAAFEQLNGIVHTATQTVWPGRNRPESAPEGDK